MAPDSDPGASPIVFDTLAVTGGMPNARRVGNVISVPDPTTVLMVPAATPASRMATISPKLTGRAAPLRSSQPGRQVEQQAEPRAERLQQEPRRSSARRPRRR